MNQILITKKLYITPELKRKKKLYKIRFCLSIFLVVALMSAYVYSEYDRTKNEQVSADILSEIENNIEEEYDVTAMEDEGILVAILTEDEETVIVNDSNTIEVTDITEETENTIYQFQGYSYKIIGMISIPKIDLKYPILDGETDTVEETDKLLETSPVKFWGPDLNENWGESPNKVGNLCIVSHNYRNSKFFSKVPTLENGDIIEVADIDGNVIQYSVYDKFEVAIDDRTVTSQKTDGKTEITLITCTDDNTLRVIVKATKI